MFCLSLIFTPRERSDTIRSIVASLVGEGGDLVDENEPIVPLQSHVEDYADPLWEPEAIDAGPGKWSVLSIFLS